MRRRASALLLAVILGGCRSPESDLGYQLVGNANVAIVAEGEAGDGLVEFTAGLLNVGKMPVYAIECTLVENSKDAAFLRLEVVETAADWRVDDDGDGRLGPEENDSVHDGRDKTSIRSIHGAGAGVDAPGFYRVNGVVMLPKNEGVYRVQIGVSYGPG